MPADVVYNYTVEAAGRGGLGWADLAGIVAFFGLVVAFISYRRASEDAASQHMHGLFRDYLKLRLDYVSKSSDLDQPFDRQLLAFKLYTLEEMFAWTWRRHGVASRVWCRVCANMGILTKIFRQIFVFLRIRDSKRDSIESWQKTISYHLCVESVGHDRNGVESRDSLAMYNECYGIMFLAFAYRVLGGLPENVFDPSSGDAVLWGERIKTVRNLAADQQKWWPMEFRPCDPEASTSDRKLKPCRSDEGG